MGIEVRNLQKHYGDFFMNLSFEVQDGETLVLAGPSGCGKTTALNLIAGLSKADGGSIAIGGTEIQGLPPWQRTVSMVFQDLALFPHLDVGGNIAYSPFIHRKSKAERKAIIQETLKIVQLSGFERRRIETLSGGERQRAAIARALAASPKALLLDEPFSSLDEPLRAQLRQEFLEIRQRSAIPWIFVTHDRVEAAILGDRIALMSRGTILEIGPREALFLAPKTEFGASFFGAGEVLPGSIQSGPTRDGTIPVNTPLGTVAIPVDAAEAAGFPAAAGFSGAAGFSAAAGSSAAADAVDSPQCRVFIPHDAVSLSQGGGAGIGKITVRGMVKHSLFQGDTIKVTLELPGGFLFSFETGPRAALPSPGNGVAIEIQESLLRFVIPQNE